MSTLLFRQTPRVKLLRDRGGLKLRVSQVRTVQRLLAVGIRVPAAALDEVFVAADVHDLAFLQHRDLIGHRQRAEVVADDDGGEVGFRLDARERFAKLDLGVGVEAAGGLSRIKILAGLRMARARSSR